MNNSQILNSTSTITPNTNKLWSITDNLYDISTFISLTIHIVYYIIVVVTKSLLKKSSMYVNHSMLVSSFYLIMSIVIEYISPINPNLNTEMNTDIAEIFWLFSCYIRFYSIVLLALYRHVSVFKQSLYKKINSSYVYVFAPIVFVWILCIGLSINARLTLHVSVSPIFLQNTNFSSSTNVIWWSFLNIFLMAIFPTQCVMVIYIIINRKSVALEKQDSNKERFTLTDMAMEISSIERVIKSKHSNAKKRRSASRFRKNANHLFLMCASMFFTCIGLGILHFKNSLPDITKVVRIWVACSISLFPLATIYYDSDIEKFFIKVDSTVYPTK